MKCVISREALLSGLQIVQNVVSTRTTLPILGNALVQASEGKLVISTTDLDTGIRASVEAEVIKGGATTLPARRLFSIIRELPAAELEARSRFQAGRDDQIRLLLFPHHGIARGRFPALPQR